MPSEPKVYVIHENAEWLPPLRSAFKALGTPYEEWALDKHLVDLDAPPPEGVFFSRMSASNYTRGHNHANDSTNVVLRWLEAHGRRVINGSGVLQLEFSKPAQQLLLSASGFAVPRTLTAIGREHTLEAAITLDRSPFFVKPAQGGKGLGVQLFQSIDELKDALAAASLPETVNDVWLVQENIETTDDFITRMEFVGGRFLYAVRVWSGGSFELCPADACGVGETGPRFEIETSPDELLVRKLEKFLAGNGIEVAGIEFIRRPDGTPVIYDINTNTNYNARAEAAAELTEGGMAAIARFLTGELEIITSTSERFASA